jgi:hypothetical protein
MTPIVAQAVPLIVDLNDFGALPRDFRPAPAMSLSFSAQHRAETSNDLLS